MVRTATGGVVPDGPSGTVTGLGHHGAMSAPSLRFAAAARALGEAARSLGLLVPGFRSPPRLDGVDRTLRRGGPDGDEIVIAVRLAGRPWVSVLADMVEGVIVANRLTGPAAGTARTRLWSAVEAEAAPDPPPRRRTTVVRLPERRVA